MLSLQDKNILVTGASSGIGKQIAITAASIGATVTLIGRNSERLEETKALMAGEGHQVLALDLTNSKCFEIIVANSKPYDGVVFNAGIVDYMPVKFLNAEKINQIFSTNLNSQMLLSQQLLKSKLVCKKGSLVFISSISSKLGVPGTALYAASKAALSAFAKVLASEVAPQGIRSNSVCPGIVLTAMTDQAMEATSTEDMAKGALLYPLGYGEPKDVAGLVMYLLSDISKWITGTDIILDGGLTLK
jgi:NAD(P)-dependent dehydrogenase (short-subunit alcohol dehydrogenase family)